MCISTANKKRNFLLLIQILHAIPGNLAGHKVLEIPVKDKIVHSKMTKRHTHTHTDTYYSFAL